MNRETVMFIAGAAIGALAMTVCWAAWAFCK